jgi:hypothetical protein
MREAYFLEEEKKWLNEKKQTLNKNGSHFMSKSVGESFLDSSQMRPIGGVFETADNLDDEKKKIKIM